MATMNDDEAELAGKICDLLGLDIRTLIRLELTLSLDEPSSLSVTQNLASVLHYKADSK